LSGWPTVEDRRIDQAAIGPREHQRAAFKLIDICIVMATYRRPHTIVGAIKSILDRPSSRFAGYPERRVVRENDCWRFSSDSD
jgi:hypothetical protein